MTEFTEVKVEQLRSELQSIPDNAGVYQWWFFESDAKKLLEAIKSAVTDKLAIKENKIEKKMINGQVYWLMYFGIANKSLRQRAKWHICQHHSASAVKSGYLSTLRVTLSALIGKAQTQSEQDVNDILDRCYFAWKSDKTPKTTEMKALEQGYFLLNIQGNKEVDQKSLRRLRKACRK